MIRVVAAVIIKDGLVMAALRRPDAARGGLWELPGGKVECGEDDRAALARELREELGMHVDVEQHVGDVEHDYGDVAIQLVAYQCMWRGGGPVLHEHAAVIWLGAEELASVSWAPADRPLLDAIRKSLSRA